MKGELKKPHIICVHMHTSMKAWDDLLYFIFWFLSPRVGATYLVGARPSPFKHK